MAFKTLSGSTSSHVSLYKISSDHGTVTTPAEIVLEANVKIDSSDTQVTLDQIKFDTLMAAFCNTYAGKVSSGTATEQEKLNLDDGTPQTAPSSGSASADQEFIGVAVGGTNADGVGTLLFVCTVNSATGGFSQENGKFTRLNVTLDLKNAVDDITFSTAASILPATIYDAAATADVPTGFAKQIKFLAAV